MADPFPCDDVEFIEPGAVRDVHDVCVVGAHEQTGELEVGACRFVEGRLEGECSEENGGLEGVWVREVV